MIMLPIPKLGCKGQAHINATTTTRNYDQSK
jgi:hypothetical protein